MAYEIVEAAAAPAGVWDAVVDASIEGWFWATHAMHDYRTAALKASGALIADRSFFLRAGDRFVGLAPLVLVRDPQSGDAAASYGDAPLPWPMVAHATGADADRVCDALFDELEARVAAAKATALRLLLSPPQAAPAAVATFRRVVRQRRMIDVSHVSHCVTVESDTLAHVRKRYRRDVEKFLPRYQLDVLTTDVGPDLAAQYMALHVLDAGRVTRPLETYERQVEFARRGEGFWVVARNRAQDRVVGMLLVALHRGAAYDSSVAVDPAFQQEHVSHLLKWRAIRHLQEHGVRHYELGPAALTPTYQWRPTDKNFGISFFKDGWSRGETKTVTAAEKFYDRAAFDRYWAAKGEEAWAHFSSGRPAAPEAPRDAANENAAGEVGSATA